jgi:small-conductance mechanosensitive channel/CRP-like cAMP-binding protein
MIALFPLSDFVKKHPLRWKFNDVDYRLDESYIRFAAYTAVIMLVVRVLDTLIFDLIASRRRNIIAPQLLRQVLSIILYVLGFGFAISVILNYSVTGFFTTTTVVAAVIGLALQETLGNLFAGISLHMEGRFEVGDVIHSGEFIGVVESVSWRATHMRAFNNQLVILPNSVIARERIEIFPKGNFNARILSIGIDYQMMPAKVIEVLTQAAAHIDGVVREVPCFARVGGFSESSVTYELKYFTRDYASRDRIDAEIRRAIWYALRRNDISIPYPVRTYKPYVEVQARHEISIDEIVARLQEVELLKPLARTEIEALAAATRLHYYSKGETILRQGDIGDSMFVIHDGAVSVRVPGDTPNVRREVAQLAPGNVFGEMALLTGEARVADVVAITDVTALEIAKDALQPILADNPDLATAITATIMRRRAETREGEPSDEEQVSVLARIRSYFGL